MARTVLVLPALLGIGLGIGLMSCEAPEYTARSSEMSGSGSGGWPDAPLADAGAGSGSGGWPDAPLADASMPDASMPDASWPDASMPDASWPDAWTFDAPPMDAYVPDAPDDCPPESPGARGAAPSAAPPPQPPKDEHGVVIPGWKGQIEINTPAPGQWWKDTDGVDPAVAGCHYAYATKCKCERNDTVVGWLGEKCDAGLLVETNPEAGKCHEHANAKGHPDTYDCDLYCKGKGHMKGSCKAVANACDGPMGAGTLASARCECE